MSDSVSRRQATQNEPAIFSTRAWQVPKKHRWQLIAACAVLAAWIVFLVAMAVYN